MTVVCIAIDCVYNYKDIPASGMYFGSYEWLLRRLTPPEKR